MSSPTLLRSFALLAAISATLSLPSAAASGADDPDRPAPVPISSYLDDPFIDGSVIKFLDAAKFGQYKDGRPTLRSSRVWIQDENVIYRKDKETDEYKPFAWNPWPETWLNLRGDLRFPNEERFPLFRVERGSDGKIILQNGLQVWTPQDLNLGATTAYEAANSVKDAAELWAGRNIVWGIEGGLLLINTHAFVEFNGFYSPVARQIFLGMVAYRERDDTIRMMETGTSWEMVAHECGHAVHFSLKPNADASDRNIRTWSESFGDQVAMWTSLRNSERIARLLAETNADLNQSNSLTRIVEAWAKLSGTGTGVRDSFHDKRISDTSDEIHDRSEVLTGAVYRIFVSVYEELKRQRPAQEALAEAARIMSIFLTRSTDYTPENRLTLEDVAKAYLKVDKEFFAGRYHALLVNEFLRRELFDATSEAEWREREAALPRLWLPTWYSDVMIDEFIQANLDYLSIAADFGLKLQSITRPSTGPAQVIVRVQLTRGRGAEATPLDNHGILVFRANGTLADYYSPLPPAKGSSSKVSESVTVQAKASAMVAAAGQLRLERHGAPLSLVRRPDGSYSVEVRVPRGEGLNAYMQVYTPENPRGERREILLSPVPVSKALPGAAAILQ